MRGAARQRRMFSIGRNEVETMKRGAVRASWGSEKYLLPPASYIGTGFLYTREGKAGSGIFLPMPGRVRETKENRREDYGI